MTSREFQERLAKRTRRVGISLATDVSSQLEAYYRLLSKWNERINLTGLDLTEPTPDALDRLLVEPIVAAKQVKPGASRLIDIGSGGGSPAVPLAVATPGSQLLMVESKTRKSVFLREVIRELKLNADVRTTRFEELLAHPDLHEAHDTLTIRAVRVEARVLSTLQAFVKPQGSLLLFRSATGSDVPSALMPPLAWVATYPLLDTLQSRLIVLEKRPIGRGQRLG